MSKKFPNRQEAETWVEDRLRLFFPDKGFSKETCKLMTVYKCRIDPERRETVARVTLWSEDVWISRIG